jgi:metal-sulfur cluster biosynthetic enzyme
VNGTLDERVREALDRVCDPCSVAAHVPVSVVDLGLVQGWQVDQEGNLLVRMCLTSWGCTLSPNIVRAAEGELAKIPELRSVRVEIDASVLWTPDRMSAPAREALRARRESSIAMTGLRPQQWRGRTAVRSQGEPGHGDEGGT